LKGLEMFGSFKFDKVWKVKGAWELVWIYTN
jgi:hypothetical protein